MQDLSMVFEGAAGQGVQTITRLLLPALKRSGLEVFACTEFMSRIRGGSNSTEIRVASIPRRAYLKRIDLLFALSTRARENLGERIGSGTLVFADPAECPLFPEGTCIAAPVRTLALQAGSPVYSNTVVAGMVFGLLGLPPEPLQESVGRAFSLKGEDIAESNRHAAMLGYDWGGSCPAGERLALPEVQPKEAGELMIMDGISALGVGTVAAGCNFISSYPMSPSTGLLTWLARQAGDFGIVVDQAEDEIAAVNAGLGASYAGARAVVTTSGGGFDLMQEGLSLAGIMELPLVVHLGQRPGPATGMPTRTEQGDLGLVVHAGHGEFPRAVFAPGTHEELATLAGHAFGVAARFQMPAFILTDQFLLDAETTVDADALRRLYPVDGVTETGDAYRRYAFTPDGLSPRGVPGFGSGVVRADSHEHTEEGLITERFELRHRMMEKRLGRLRTLREEALMPTAIGPVGDARTLLVGWGSNRGVIEEALELLGEPAIAGLHFPQVFPLNPAVATLIGDRRVVVLENNATGQFADLLLPETGIRAARRILKATGEPFSVEEVLEALQEEVRP
ncbi:MAG: 2-oxoacid:acceptor oxidoreductase subunit alpha [Chlorobi bacterium]|nr:2-oxoacid:acceptor oxidoreductase subunit alpha [Chlorobiota bacterium]